MGIEWAPEAGVKRKGQNGYSVLPKNVIMRPELSGRAEASDVAELAEDIDVNGQLQPCMCWKNEQGWPVLAAGHRRYRALMKINEGKPEEEQRHLIFNSIPAKNEQEAYDYTIRENRNRNNPSPLDDAHNMHVYMHRFGLSEEGIALKYFPGAKTPEEKQKALTYVKKTLSINSLSETAKEEIKNGFISTSAAHELAAIPSRKTQDEVIRDSRASGAKRLKVSAAKKAKESAIGKQRNRQISENNPKRVIERYKTFADIAIGLAWESLAKKFHKKPNHDVIEEFAEQIAVMAFKLKLPMAAELDKWASENQNLPTVLDKQLA